MKDLSHKTAIKRTNTSKPVRDLLEGGYIKGKILDYGCGHGKDIEELKKKGFEVYGFDKYFKHHSIDTEGIKEEQFDTILLIYVFNVISDLEEHKELVKFLRNTPGKVYISVRKDIRAVKRQWVYDRESRGHWTTRGTFQRFYNKELIEEFFGDTALIKETSSYILFSLI